MTGGGSSLSSSSASFFHVQVLRIILLVGIALDTLPVQALNAEGVALYSFRDLIIGDPTGVFDTWNQLDETPCNWTGVSCNDNRVTRLFLNDLGLSGSLGGNFSELLFLRTLSISKNSLSGSIPPELSDTVSLYKVNLSGNSLSGSIPAGFGNLSSLRQLDLSGNSLSGPISPQLFSNCHRLRYISLANNGLTQAVPASIGSCQNLVGIDFSQNNLQSFIPEEIGNLSQLVYFSVEQNYISGTIPSTLGNCTSLEYLNLGSNSLSGAVPAAFKDLSYLLFLGLYENFLSGNVGPNSVYLPSLLELNLSVNHFSGALPAVTFGGNCTVLEILDLSSNNFSGAFPPRLGRCAQLRSLILSFNRLSSSLPKALFLLSNVTIIDLSSNNLSGNIPVQLGNLRRLAVLRLGYNGISGSIPHEVGELSSLEELSLQSMALVESIPLALTKCTSLVILDLALNKLSGNIPGNMSTLSNLTVLSLSENSLVGIIPSDFGKLRSLQYLDLSYNALDGQIPASLGLLSDLTFFNVSFNNLSGPVPTGVLENFNQSSYLGNVGLCGFPLNTLCTPRSPAPGPFAPPMISESGSTKTLSASSIIAISAAAVIAVGVMVVTVMNIRAIRRRQKQREILVYESTPPSPEASPIVGKLVLFSKSLPSRYEDWETGTKALLDKDCMIGRGTIGSVYKATFDGGLSIAVKKLETLGRIKNQDDFEHEMGLLGNVKHPNLVPLQGYYWSSTMQLLLSDYVPNRSLFYHLHEENEGQTSSLTWARRFKIALGTAKGISYLHHDCKPRVLHFNIKVSNILLDDNFEPRISDYGLAKLLPMLDTYVSSRKFHTTLGYVAPELACQSLRLTDKCDVYSFGMVLLELVTGRQPVESHESNVVVLGEFVRSALEQGRVVTCIDPRLEFVHESEIMQVLKLALICTSSVPSRRPSMAEVVQVLESIKPASTGNSSQTTSP